MSWKLCRAINLVENNFVKTEKSDWLKLASRPMPYDMVWQLVLMGFMVDLWTSDIRQGTTTFDDMNSSSEAHYPIYSTGLDKPYLNMTLYMWCYNKQLFYLPNSKLGITTGPYFIIPAYPPSPCTRKSAARLNFPLPRLLSIRPKLLLIISGSYATIAT